MHTHICAIFHNGTRTCLGVRESPSVDAHVPWGARVALRRRAQNRLQIGVRREGTVLDDIVETYRSTRMDG